MQTAGGPLGGDEVQIAAEVGPGAGLELRTIAATVVLPGDAPALQAARVRLAEGARLLWHAEPVIVTARAHYEALLDLDLAAGAAALVRESVVRGRHGEPGGSVDMLLRCDMAGRPLLRDAVRIAPAAMTPLDGTEQPKPPRERAIATALADSPAVLAGARAFGSVALLGVRCPSGLPEECALGGPGCLVRAVAHDAADLEAALSRATEAYARALGADVAAAAERLPARSPSIRSRSAAARLAPRSISQPRANP